MKIFSWLSIGAACAILVSCGKPQSEPDRSAQIEKETQARLEAEHRLQENHRLKQQQAELDAREKALAAREAAATNETEPTATPRVVVRDRESSEEEQAPQSYDTFYRKLEPYGAWRESADYGYVWQPSVAADSRNWRPYTDGRWAYTEAGWTWISDEPFGWATYHYGRWTRLSEIGWVWVPGDEWAPAWVSWRTGDRHVGWAPLPPEARFERRTGIKHWADSYYDIDAGEYVFVPNEDIGDENIQRAAIPAERNVTIVNETTNVTNITYNNTTIVNEGPSYDSLGAHSRRPVQRLRLQREYGVDRPSARAVISGEVVQMVTPLFTAHATERPHTAAPPIQRTTVEHIASTSDQAEVERAREKMKSEATPPPDAPSKKFEKPVVAETASTPAQTATATPESTASAAPIATVAPTLSVAPRATPSPHATVTTRALPSPTVRPTFTPRPAPSATPSGTVAATPRPHPTGPVTRSTPARPTATPLSTDAVERRRQEARDKAM
ncbi:MAG: DUF6600 domain-containing protein, partial [Chthoniobacterales bacterium]